MIKGGLLISIILMGSSCQLSPEMRRAILQGISDGINQSMSNKMGNHSHCPHTHPNSR